MVIQAWLKKNRILCGRPGQYTGTPGTNDFLKEYYTLGKDIMGEHNYIYEILNRKGEGYLLSIQ